MGCGASSSGGNNGIISMNSFDVQITIGEGGFGKVNAAILKQRRKEEEWFAIKAMKKHVICESNNLDMIFNERNLLIELESKFLANIKYAMQDERYLYLVLDLCLGGDLRYNLCNNPDSKRNGFSEDRAKFYIASMLKALEYMHSKDIIHRDIKPDNLLLDSDGYLKITDLGISAKLDEHGKCMRKSGTKWYMAPETIRRESHGKESDFYSVGVVLFEFLTLSRPWSQAGTVSAMAVEETLDKNVRLNHVSEECKDFLVQILQDNPADRLGHKSISDIFNHSWFQDFDFDGLSAGTLPAPFKPDTSKANCETGTVALFDMMAVEEEIRKPPADQQARFVGYEYKVYPDDAPISEKAQASAVYTTKAVVPK